MRTDTLKTGTPTATPLHLGLAVLRVVVGLVFLVHGYQKLFVMGIPGVTEFFTQIGAPLPGLSAPLVSVLEFAGGIALILGVLTPVVAALLAADMLGAILLVHLPNGFSVSAGGYEFVLTLLAASLALALTGPSAYALDAAFRRGRSSPAEVR
jgi:putative oxidoreductase